MHEDHCPDHPTLGSAEYISAKACYHFLAAGVAEDTDDQDDLPELEEDTPELDVGGGLRLNDA